LKNQAKGKARPAFAADVTVLMMKKNDAERTMPASAEHALAARATRLHDLTRRRDQHFRRTVMADGAMAVMLSLFLAELKAVSLSPATLALINLLENDQCDTVIESLIHAGLASVTEGNSERRTVGLTALGSARMRSFVSDYPEV
jgi:hypothetical protein